MSDTPRTDAYNPNPESKWRGFAQRLERELRAAIAERNEARDDYGVAQIAREQLRQRNFDLEKQLAAAKTLNAKALDILLRSDADLIPPHGSHCTDDEWDKLVAELSAAVHQVQPGDDKQVEGPR